jgi:hypothetical protein
VLPHLPLHHFAAILDTSWPSVGALLIFVGAVLVIGDALSGGPTTWGGTYADPIGRAAVAVALVGTLLVVAGSSILLAESGVSMLAVGVVIALALALTLVAMAGYLKQHMNLVDRDTPDARHSWWWCLCHPLWRPPSNQ